MSWLDTVTFNTDGLIPAIAQDHKTGRMLMMAWMNAESLQLTADTKTAVYFSRSRQKLWHKGETSGHTQQIHSICLDCDADVIVLSITQIGGISCHTGRESCFYRKLDFTGQQPVWQITDSVLKNPDDIYGNHHASHEAPHNNKPIPDEPSHNEHNHDDSSRYKQPSDEQNILETSDVLSALDAILLERKNANADSSYVASLYHKGLNKILEKVGEESFETIIAAKDYQNMLDQEYESNHHKNDLVYEIADVWFHTMVTLAWFNISSEVVLAELARRFGLSGIDEKASRKA